VIPSVIPPVIPPRSAHPATGTVDPRASASAATIPAATIPAATIAAGSGRAPGPAADRSGRPHRLRSGELRALVAQTLTARDGGGLTVTQLSNLLRRSPGAIANAAERLCEQGVAARTQQSPKTYRSTSGESRT
jgi:hypothetical protein